MQNLSEHLCETVDFFGRTNACIQTTEPHFSSSNIYAQTQTLTSDELDEVASLRSASLVSPAPSLYSLTSSMKEQSYRLAHGRSVNSRSEIYGLPADDEEIQRLERQHRMFQTVIGRLPPSLSEVLAPGPGIQRSVLDLGCGSGAWVREVAQTFPECLAVGVDLAPVQLPIPENCRTEVDDINLGLDHFHDGFNAVHARFICTGIQDYAGLVDQIARCLRSRGLIALYENDFRIFYPDKTLCPPWSTVHPESEASYICKWFSALEHAVRMRGGSADASTLLPIWIRQHPSFTEMEMEEWFIPMAPYKHGAAWVVIDRYPEEFMTLMNEDIHTFIRGGRLLLLACGMNEANVDYLESQAHLEVDDLSCPKFVRMQAVYARKKAIK